MSRRYRNVWHRPVEGVAPGKEAELELTAQEEAEYLAWGRLEILPVEYEVVGPKKVNGCEPGSKFKAPLTIGQELHLVASGHIVPVSAGKPGKADKES